MRLTVKKPIGILFICVRYFVRIIIIIFYFFLIRRVQNARIAA